ncbi:hypothetical protein HYY69_06240 [Candidatus Woesearchaeota archaeon]|nr:hypothetical protein [Candidatus Woesearchaeota archaeon]
MKELLDALSKINLAKAKNLVLIDTCFLVHCMDKGFNKKLTGIPNLALTSFNAEELLHIHHHLHHNINKSLRSFLKQAKFQFVDLPVHPGNRLEEISFVGDIDRQLLMHVHDPSDAVLIAAAIATKSDVLTRDKHHLFTVELENFLDKYGISVYNELKHLAY